MSPSACEATAVYPEKTTVSGGRVTRGTAIDCPDAESIARPAVSAASGAPEPLVALGRPVRAITVVVVPSGRGRPERARGVHSGDVVDADSQPVHELAAE